LVVGWQQAKSALLGGMAAFIPNLYFAWRINRSSGLEAKKIVRSFYAGESAKLLLTAAIFAIVLQMPKIEVLTLFLGYIAVLSVFWFALLMR
jgi:ATP synthase protein I